MRAVGYLRVSSKTQRDRQTVDSQRRAIPEYVARQGWSLVRPVDHYVDDGMTAKSGHLGDRAAFTRLLADAAAGAFDVVVVVDLDRLTRSEDLTERGAVLGAFQRAGVKIATVNGGQILDLSSSLGDLFSGLQAFFAAEENRKRRERTVAGQATARARGKKPSGPTPYGLGYDKEGPGRWWIDEVAGPIVHELYERVARRESCESIAVDLRERGVLRPRGGAWIRERVWQIVTSRTYIGEFTAHKAQKIVIRVPAIVDVGLWERAQAVLESQRRRGLRRTKHSYLLEELAVCARCGARIGISSGSQVNGTVSRYVCSHRRRPPHGTPACSLACVKTEDADDRLWRSLESLLAREDALSIALGRNKEATEDAGVWQRDLDEAERRVAKLAAAEVDTLARHRRGQISDAGLDSTLVAIARERKMFERQATTARRALTSKAAVASHAEALTEALHRAHLALETATPEARRHVIRALFPPGSIIVGEPEIVATLRLSPLSSGDVGATSSAPGATVEIRLVA